MHHLNNADSSAATHYVELGVKSFPSVSAESPRLNHFKLQAGDDARREEMGFWTWEICVNKPTRSYSQPCKENKRHEILLVTLDLDSTGRQVAQNITHNRQGTGTRPAGIREEQLAGPPCLLRHITATARVAERFAPQ